MTHQHPEAQQYEDAADQLVAAADRRRHPSVLGALELSELLDDYARAARNLNHECAQIRPPFLERAAELLRQQARP